MLRCSVSWATLQTILLSILFIDSFLGIQKNLTIFIKSSDLLALHIVPCKLILFLFPTLTSYKLRVINFIRCSSTITTCLYFSLGHLIKHKLIIQNLPLNLLLFGRNRKHWLLRLFCSELLRSLIGFNRRILYVSNNVLVFYQTLLKLLNLLYRLNLMIRIFTSVEFILG